VWLVRYGHQIGQVRAALDWAFSPTGAAEVGVALTDRGCGAAVGALGADGGMSPSRRVGAFRARREPRRASLQLHAALGAVALFVTKGSGPEAVAAWTSAFEIAESLDDVDYAGALGSLWRLPHERSL
jgi:hypothetical protein